MPFLEFVPLSPQPKGPTRCEVDGTGLIDETDSGIRWHKPAGWSDAETVTQMLFGRECWVRMVPITSTSS